MSTTVDKSYLDKAGLEHLKDINVLVKHPTTSAATEASAVKVKQLANGHIQVGSAITPADIGAVATEDLGDGTLTIKANGTQKGTFTANQKGNTEINITLADFDITNAMHFVGTTTTDISDGATTSSITVQGKTHAAAAGDVVLYGGKEFVWNSSSWEELGAEGSHALKSVKIEAGAGLTITKGGTLAGDTTISHATYPANPTAAVTPSAVQVGRDAYGHVILGSTLAMDEQGAHTHTVNIPQNTVVVSTTPTTKNLKITPTTAKAIQSLKPTAQQLATTTITGTNGTVNASLVKSQTNVAVATVGTATKYGTANVSDKSLTVATKAKNATPVGDANYDPQETTIGNANVGTAVVYGKANVGTAVTYGKANVGTAIEKIAQVAAQPIIYGNANAGTAVDVTAYDSNTPAYTAAYNAQTECLTFTAIGSVSITPAETSSQTAYVCADASGISITPAVAAPNTQTLTPAVAAPSTQTLTPAAASTNKIHGALSSTGSIYGVADEVTFTPAVEAPSTQTLLPAVANGTITNYTFETVTPAKVAASATTVATGSLVTTGGASTILTAVEADKTIDALVSANIATTTETGDITVVTGVTANKNTTKISINNESAGTHKHTIS